jgi:hypothetical protein
LELEKKVHMVVQTRAWLLGISLVGIFSGITNAQSMSDSAALPSSSNGEKTGTPLVCPGGFPTDLSVTNCLYTPGMRGNAFIENSLTDKSILEAVVFGGGAQVVQSPGEWKRTWDGYGRRVGVRYNQAVAKGAAEFLTGALMQDDPRNVSYRNDPRVAAQRTLAIQKLNKGESPDFDPYSEDPHAALAKRIGHAFFDSVTVRRSSLDGNGRRLPAMSRFVGAFASAYGGYAWYPGPENTFKNASLRAAQSFGTDVGASFYTEFEPDVARLLGAIFKRGRQAKKQPAGTAETAPSGNEVTEP